MHISMSYFCLQSQSSGGRGFLSDNFRDSHHSARHGGEGRTNRDMRGEGQDNSRGGGGGPPHRHFRNYGGGDQPVDLRDKIKKERQHGQVGYTKQKSSTGVTRTPTKHKLPVMALNYQPLRLLIEFLF